MVLDKGVDAEGFVLNPCSSTKAPPAYRDLLGVACERVAQHFPDLHSIYLYGSVGRGEAIAGTSDLDLVTVFNRRPSDLEQARLRELAQQLAKEYPVAVKVDFDVGFVAEILAPDQELNWQFFLKHCCSCLRGTDLSLDFPKQRPSKDLGRRLNANIGAKIQGLLDAMNEENAASQGKAVAKQLIRSAYFLTIEEDGSFYHRINICAETFLNYHPDKTEEITTALVMASANKASLAEVHALAESLGAWIIHFKD